MSDFFVILGDTYLPMSYALYTLYLCTMSDFSWHTTLIDMKCINNNKMKCWGNKFCKITNNTHRQQNTTIHKITITHNNGSTILHPHKMCNINDKDLVFFVFSSISFHQEPTIKTNKTSKVNSFLKAVFCTIFNLHILVVPSVNFQANLSWRYHQFFLFEDHAKHCYKNECTLL